MRIRKLVVSALSVLALAAPVLAADAYKIDAAHSSVGFSVKHLVITNTKGVFKDFAGSVVYDEKDLAKSSVDVTIQVVSIDTANAKRDEHLRTADFFDAATFPVVTFKSSKVEKADSGYSMTGTLTMRGVSKEVTFPFSMTGPVQDPWGNTRFGAEGSLTVNRQDYGISWNKTLDNGGLVVGDEVKIELVVEAVKEAPPAPAGPAKKKKK